MTNDTNEAKQPIALDLYCCEGGSSMGLSQAGFEVVGNDIFEEYSQKRYPFPSFKGDSLKVLEHLIAGEPIEFGQFEGKDFVIKRVLKLSDISVITASPPCQHASVATSSIRKNNGKTYPHLIPPTRDLLMATKLPYIIENVRGSDLREPTELCGCMFDLKAIDTDGIMLYLQRARRFESNVPLVAPREHDHSLHEWVGGSYGGSRKDKYDAKFNRKGGYVPSIPVQQKLLGINWATQKAMFQSIPPAYTKWLGTQLLQYLGKNKIG
jgi:DNA (cytosine-5)-methyltransferase 1